MTTTDAQETTTTLGTRGRRAGLAAPVPGRELIRRVAEGADPLAYLPFAGQRGGWLWFVAPSQTTDAIYTVRIAVDGDGYDCPCAGCRAGSRTWHRVLAEAARDRYCEHRAIYRGMGPAALAQQIAWLEPGPRRRNIDIPQTLQYQAMLAVRDEREREVA